MSPGGLRSACGWWRPSTSLTAWGQGHRGEPEAGASRDHGAWPGVETTPRPQEAQPAQLPLAGGPGGRGGLHPPRPAGVPTPTTSSRDLVWKWSLQRGPTLSAVARVGRDVTRQGPCEKGTRAGECPASRTGAGLGWPSGGGRLVVKACWTTRPHCHPRPAVSSWHSARQPQHQVGWGAGALPSWSIFLS